jgi:hypothetical protein
MFLRKVGFYRRVYTAQKPRKSSPSSTPWKNQISLQPWRWRQHLSPKRWHLTMSLYGAKTQKNIIIIFTSVCLRPVAGCVYRCQGPWGGVAATSWSCSRHTTRDAWNDVAVLNSGHLWVRWDIVFHYLAIVLGFFPPIECQSSQKQDTKCQFPVWVWNPKILLYMWNAENIIRPFSRQPCYLYIIIVSSHMHLSEL